MASMLKRGVLSLRTNPFMAQAATPIVHPNTTKTRSLSVVNASQRNQHSNSSSARPTMSGVSMASLAAAGIAAASITMYHQRSSVAAAPADNQAAAAALPPLPPLPGAGAAAGGVGALPPLPVANAAAPATSSLPPLPTVGSSAAPTDAATSTTSAAAAFSSFKGDKPKKKKEKLPQPGRLEEFDNDHSQVMPHQVQPGMHFVLIKNMFPTGLMTNEQGPVYQNAVAQGIPPTNKQLTVQVGMHQGDPGLYAPPEGFATLDVTTRFDNQQQQHELATHIEGGGPLSGGYIWRPIPRKLEIANRFSIHPDPSNTGFATDVTYKGKDYTVQGGHQSFQSGNVAYIQSLTPTIAGGISMAANPGTSQYAVEPMVRWRRVSETEMINGAPHPSKSDTITANINSLKKAYTVTYARTLAPLVSIATDFGHNYGNGEAKAAVGLRQQGMTYVFQASMDTNGQLTSTLDNYLGDNATIHVGATMNHWKPTQESPPLISLGVDLVI